MNVYMAAVYSTGKPCKRGHIAPRFVSTRNCTECNRQRARVSNMTDTQIAKKRERDKTWASKNPEAITEIWRRYYENNREEVIADTRLQQLKRHQRCPEWADKSAIIQFYLNCPDGYEVDHIIPLNGELVSGLHVLNNLQYLTVRQNRAKGNRFL